jgi:hypothetical protein
MRISMLSLPFIIWQDKCLPSRFARAASTATLGHVIICDHSERTKKSGSIIICGGSDFQVVTSDLLCEGWVLIEG